MAKPRCRRIKFSPDGNLQITFTLLGAAKTILFVDDESELRFMVASYFEMSGYTVLTAGNAEEAARVSAGALLGAIILDVNLAGGGSSKLMELLKQSHPGVPIILYTGREVDDEIVTGMLDQGAQRYLLKDGTLAGLLAAVKDAWG